MLFAEILTAQRMVVSMKKDAQFTLRIATHLRRELQGIANNEGRSMAQICEAFLKAGSETYKKQGPKFLQRFLTKVS